MIRNDLLEFQYYLDRLSRFMQESYGINEQVRTFWSLLKQANVALDEYLNQMNLFKEIPEGELLDHIGAIFGCKRKFTFPIYVPGGGLFEIDHYYTVDLSDEDFLTFIKTQIIKQNFDGKRETLQKLYTTYIDGVEQPGLVNLRFIYYTTDEAEGGVCDIYWDILNVSEDMRNLFEQGFLTVESVGIKYTRSVINLNELAYFANAGESPQPNTVFHIIQYNPLGSSKPADWDSGGWKNYYKIVAQVNPDTTWDPTSVYATVSSGVYTILTREPINYSDVRTTLFKLTITQDSTWASNTYYSKSERGGQYS